jgi:hypothetical protein
MTDRWVRPDIRRKAPLTPEEEKARRLQLAREALKGFPVFDRMDKDAQDAVITNTAYVIGVIVYKYKGRFRDTSPKVAWDALNRGYSRRKDNELAFVEFRQALGDSAEKVYKNAFAMLEAGVNTKEALDAIGKPPPDVLEGIRGGPKDRRDRRRKRML